MSLSKKLGSLQSEAQRRATAARAVLDDARNVNERAQVVLAEAKARLTTANAALDVARSEYRDAPSDAKGKKVRAARDAAELVELELERPLNDATVAEQALTLAMAAEDSARADVARVEREIQAAELRAKASVERFRAATDPHVARILGAYSEIQALARTIDSEWQAARAAADSLASLGACDCPDPLSGQHLLAGFALALSRQDSMGFVAQQAWSTENGRQNPLYAAENGQSLAAILRLDAIDRFTTPHPLNHTYPDAQAKLERILSMQDPERERLAIDKEDRRPPDATLLEVLAPARLARNIGDTMRSFFGTDSAADRGDNSVEAPPANPESSEPSVSESAAP